MKVWSQALAEMPHSGDANKIAQAEFHVVALDDILA